MKTTATTVSLLQRPYPKTGKLSLYLDFYPAIRHPRTGKMTRREYLGIYLYLNPRNQQQRDFNAEMLEKGEAIRCLRYTALLNEQFGFLDHDRWEGDFLEYFKQQCRHHDQKWQRVYDHFKVYCKGACKFSEITQDFCTGFRTFLLSAKQIKYPDRTLSNNSACGYWSTFRGLLKIAYRDKKIRENVNDYLEKIEWQQTKKQFLLQDECKALLRTPCKYPVLKRAALFACLTGLRISDILALRWEHIEMLPDLGWSIRIRTEKTETEATLPINNEALELCGERGEGRVFQGMSRYHAGKPFKAWLLEAGITKKITFHCLRNSFATMQAAAGTDIFTLSKMLTHKCVTTTQIYAELVSEKKREAADRLSFK